LKPRDQNAASPSHSTSDSSADARRLMAFLAKMTFPEYPREPCPSPAIPFESLPPISPETKAAIESAALESNDRFLETFLEPNSFCPFSRGGRQRGQTVRFVYYADTTDLTPLLDRMADAARDPSKLVIQVIVPMIEVSAEAWSRFCHEVTAVGNDRLRDGPGNGDNLYAVAPLHPELRYSSSNPFALIPLFRRTPDPTIQWVRLDALESLYSGRTGDTVYADLDDLESFLAKPRRNPLFDRIAETNMKMALRLGIPEVERSLRDLARSAQDRYARILLSDVPPKPQSRPGCPHRPTTPASDTTPPRPALLERNGQWALVRVDELLARVPVRFLANDVEVVAIRVGEEVHVLHGRCPHRYAPLTDAVVEDERIVCPHHGWDFQLSTGRSDGVPGAAVARFRSRTDDGLLWVDGAELQAWRVNNEKAFRADDDVL